jgi:RNA polymerase sigma-70 factor (ECF subfamily)
MPETDRSLVARAQAGDAQAYTALLERHRGRLLRVCVGSLGDPAAAADVAQDAALVAWLQLDRLQEPARFGAWLAGIGRVLSLRVLRERAASPERLTRDGSLPDHAADRRDDPAERLLARERAGELAAAISALPAGQRDAVVLFHLADLPQATIAARLGTAAGAVRTRLHKARGALRTRLTTTPDTTQESPMPQTAVPARIVDVRRTPAGRHVVVLATAEAELPIWIGAPDAEALVVGLEHVELPRPSAHALALSLLRACGRAPASVRITRLDAAIFYAEVLLDHGAAVDARPSDALVLAVAAGIPIEIDPAVIAATRSGAPAEYAEDLARAADDGAALLAGELRADLAARAAEVERLQDQREGA